MAGRRASCGADRAADALEGFLMITPSWVGPLVAAVCFLFLRLVLPALITVPDQAANSAIRDTSRLLAPFVTFAVVVLWIIAEFKKRGRRRLLDSRSSIDGLRSLSWQKFEQLVGEAFRRRGYAVEEAGGGGADGGVDLVLRQDGETTLVQCKQWKSSKVGVKIVRELYGVMAAQQAARGIVVCCGRFTKEARTFAEGNPIDLVDGEMLWSLVEQVKAGAGDKQQATSQPNQPPSEHQTLPTCPTCGSPMVLRTASRGKHAGSEFYGCRTYPDCRGIRQIME